MTRCIVIGLLALVGAGCGDNQEVPDCAAGAVVPAGACGGGWVACQGPDRSPVEGCMLHLRHAPGEPYDAECVAACPAGAVAP